MKNIRIIGAGRTVTLITRIDFVEKRSHYTFSFKRDEGPSSPSYVVLTKEAMEFPIYTPPWYVTRPGIENRLRPALVLLAFGIVKLEYSPANYEYRILQELIDCVQRNDYTM